MMRIQVKNKRFTARPGFGGDIHIEGPNGWSSTAFRGDGIFESWTRAFRPTARAHILRHYFGETK